jgi:hypothetical protein
MTFCLAVGRPYLGLVSADTRASADDAGHRVLVDHDEVTVTNPLGGPPIVLPATFRKVRRFGSGWMTGSGVIQWLCPALDALSDPRIRDVDSAGDCVREFSRRAIPAIKAAFPDVSEATLRTSAAIYIVKTSDGGAFNCHQIDTNGDVWDAATGVCGAVGADAHVAGLTGIMRSYEAEFTTEGYAHGFYGMLRRTAATVLAVHDLVGPVGSVSSSVEMGLTHLTRAGRRITQHLAPVSCRDLMVASDHDLQALLESA